MGGDVLVLRHPECLSPQVLSRPFSFYKLVRYPRLTQNIENMKHTLCHARFDTLVHMAYTWNIYTRHLQTLVLEVSCIVYAKLLDQYSGRKRPGSLSDGVLGSILPLCLDVLLACLNGWVCSLLEQAARVMRY